MLIDNVAFTHDERVTWNVPLTVTKHHILFLITNGTAYYHFGDEVVQINKGEGMYIREGTLRRAETNMANPLRMYSAHFRGIAAEDLSVLSGDSYKLIRPLNYDYLKQRFSMLYECWIGMMPNYELISRGIILELLGVVQRDLTGDAHSSSRRNLALRVQQYIVQNYREQLHLDELALVVDRSPTYVSTVFKEVTGRTPIEYMHQVRISAARELLQTSNMTVGEISESLGYCDQTYFTYIYKKIVGHPPSHMLKVRRAAKNL